jgi:hypothetical protein
MERWKDTLGRKSWTCLLSGRRAKRQLKSFVGTIQDITERKEHEEKEHFSCARSIIAPRTSSAWSAPLAGPGRRRPHEASSSGRLSCDRPADWPRPRGLVVLRTAQDQQPCVIALLSCVQRTTAFPALFTWKLTYLVTSRSCDDLLLPQSIALWPVLHPVGCHRRDKPGDDAHSMIQSE